MASNDAIAWSTAFWFWKTNIICGPNGQQVYLVNLAPLQEQLMEELNVVPILLTRLEIDFKYIRTIENGCYNWFENQATILQVYISTNFNSVTTFNEYLTNYDTYLIWHYKVLFFILEPI